jgi:hypothetical protein
MLSSKRLSLIGGRVASSKGKKKAGFTEPRLLDPYKSGDRLQSV